MIVKRNLSLRRVAAYTARPMAWVVAWSFAVPAIYLVVDDDRLVAPFAPVAAIGAALAIFIAFRNNSAFGRWMEGRAAWQSILVASRAIIRQVIASTDNALALGDIDSSTAEHFRNETTSLLSAFAHSVAAPFRPTITTKTTSPSLLTVELGVLVKRGIRDGALGQFDPIALEPQLAALNNAQGTIERIASTPTLRQYDFFTRRFVELFAVLAPFAIIGLVPDRVWWTVPLSIAVSGVFVVMAVTGAANDEPFSGMVTDVPIAAVCAEVDHDLAVLLGDPNPPPLAQPVDGYLW
ncbi:MAG: bestrophin family ion channel [Actinomycetota bacterium]